MAGSIHRSLKEEGTLELSRVACCAGRALGVKELGVLVPWPLSGRDMAAAGASRAGPVRAWRPWQAIWL